MKPKITPHPTPPPPPPPKFFFFFFYLNGGITCKIRHWNVKLRQRAKVWELIATSSTVEGRGTE
jgi:hypothetical protein